MKRKLVIAAAAILVFSCRSGKSPEAKFFDEVGALSKEEIMTRGDAQATDKKWEAARRYYSFLGDAFPNDPLGRQAAIRVADTFFSQGSVDGFTEAQLRYRDFSNRFPNDPNRPYALLMLGKCSLEQSRGPLRDLAPVREAAESLRQVVEQFANSPQAPEARELLKQCNETLAGHELEVARFNASVGAIEGARMRLEYLVSSFPDTNAAAQGRVLLQKLEDQVEPDRGTTAPTGDSKKPVG